MTRKELAAEGTRKHRELEDARNMVDESRNRQPVTCPRRSVPGPARDVVSIPRGSRQDSPTDRCNIRLLLHYSTLYPQLAPFLVQRDSWIRLNSQNVSRYGGTAF